MASAPTIGDAVTAIIEFDAISNSYFRLSSEVKKGFMRVYLSENYIPEDLLGFLVERDIMAGLTAIKPNLPVKLNEVIHSISFSHEKRADIENYKKAFIDNIYFNHPLTFFNIYHSAMEIPIPDTNRKTFELLRQQCQVEYSLKSRNRFFISDHVKLCIQTQKGNISLSEVSEQLKMSERSLSRLLSKENTSFRKVKQQVILQQSLFLLRDPKFTVEQISDLLGFSETCAFSRAFQKWTGMTPGKYKKEGLEAKPR